MSIAIPWDAPDTIQRTPIPPTRPGWAANPKEDKMFKLTCDDLHRKTDAQLVALFREASKGLATGKPGAPAAQSLVAMIRTEIARRGPLP